MASEAEVAAVMGELAAVYGRPLDAPEDPEVWSGIYYRALAPVPVEYLRAAVAEYIATVERAKWGDHFPAPATLRRMAWERMPKPESAPQPLTATTATVARYDEWGPLVRDTPGAARGPSPTEVRCPDEGCHCEAVEVEALLSCPIFSEPTGARGEVRTSLPPWTRGRGRRWVWYHTAARHDLSSDLRLCP